MNWSLISYIRIESLYLYTENGCDFFFKSFNCTLVRLFWSPFDRMIVQCSVAHTHSHIAHNRKKKTIIIRNEIEVNKQQANHNDTTITTTYMSNNSNNKTKSKSKAMKSQ